MTDKNKIQKRIQELEIELSACEEHGYNFSASQIEREIKRLEKLLKK